ncbi:MAG TPA: 2Fe-2S iron-sulfur cluster-binding protein [Bacillota bacterium]|nr:2Fe-2S iron-sulfur cluster-binding protein [Bacillota bacterium]
MKGEFVVIDGRSIELNGEKNLLEVARKAGIDIPTFCYHSQLSVYGACRLCIVDIEGRGVVTSCSTTPEPA